MTSRLWTSSRDCRWSPLLIRCTRLRLYMITHFDPENELGCGCPHLHGELVGPLALPQFWGREPRFKLIITYKLFATLGIGPQPPTSTASHFDLWVTHSNTREGMMSAISQIQQKSGEELSMAPHHKADPSTTSGQAEVRAGYQSSPASSPTYFSGSFSKAILHPGAQKW